MQSSDFETAEIADDRLLAMFRQQFTLQREVYAALPHGMTHPEQIKLIKDNILAATDELHEALNEVGWKPWATSQHVNTEKYVGELIDLWHFFMNLMLIVVPTPEEAADVLFKQYREKRARNIQRQARGYDGITGKCPTCKRALDDLDAVKKVLTGGTPYYVCGGCGRGLTYDEVPANLH